jgi:hypothetical protein
MSHRPTPLQQEFAALRHHVREANKHARVSQDRFGFRVQQTMPWRRSTRVGQCRLVDRGMGTACPSSTCRPSARYDKFQSQS